QKIFEVDLQDKPKLDRVRDLFIVGCYTGLRYADLGQLNADMISPKGELIKIKTKKTGEVVVIPMHPLVMQVFEKYDGNLPRVLSNQKFNEYIKLVGRKAGLTNSVPVSKTRCVNASICYCLFHYFHLG
ncbi:unnamed protein product, partial [marine sediment metagenome]